MDTQPEQDGDRILTLLAISMVLLLAGLEIALLLPEVLREAHGLMDAIYLCISFVTLVLLWLFCLYVERRHQYERKEAKWHRRRGYLIQVMVLGVYTVSQIQGKYPAAPLVLVALIGLTYRVWRSWMNARALTPERQKEIDELLEERDRRFKERIAAERAEASELRFQAVRARYELPGTPTVATPTEAAGPTIDWQIPKGRHTDVVYFLRNGDRAKIGTTTDLRARVRRLSLRMDDLVLVIAGGLPVERSMHQKFRELRVGNTEWFQYRDSLLQYVTEQRSEILAEGGDQA